MQRVAVLGNSGGGKSAIARTLARRFDLPCVELDPLLWRPDWTLVPIEAYEAEHGRLIAGDRWILDGLGRLESMPDRLARASDVVLVDMPLWMHYWLAAERQIAWATGRLAAAPAGAAVMPPTQGLFRTMWDVEREWLPRIRRWVDAAQARGARVVRLASVDAVTAFTNGA